METNGLTARAFMVVVIVSLCTIGQWGCRSKPFSRLMMNTPSIQLHVYEDPDDLEGDLKTEGDLVVSRRPDEHGPEVFVIDGAGLMSWGSNTVVIESRAVVVNGVRVESRLGASWRNVYLSSKGEVKPDVSIPWEP